MRRQTAILLFVLGYMIYISYAVLQTTKQIEAIENKSKTIKEKP